MKMQKDNNDFDDYVKNTITEIENTKKKIEEISKDIKL